MTDAEKLKRWRLILGGDAADGIGATLDSRGLQMDRALSALYEPKSGKRQAGLGASSPHVARWLGDIREFFPSSVVRVMQQDAMDRLGLRQLLLEPEMLESVEPDVHLVADLLSLAGAMKGKSRETARIVVRKCVEDVQRRLAEPVRQAVNGALNRSIRNRRPKHREIDWNRTVRANLRHYQPQYKTVVPETRIGFGRKRSSLRDIILCIDQSGSMATSVVYSGILGAVLASLPSVSTKVVAFDTAVVDLTEKLSDPVDVLFGTQLGGGTDIGRALAYCQSLITRPADTIFVLISDLIEGGVRETLIKRAASIINSGVTMVTLLALSDDGAPAFDHTNASDLATLGSPAFACTPDLFPELIAAAIQKRDIGQWASEHDLGTARG
ncbi:MAG TPA: VWA domain-containing protein [Tepidisphaeraceae bacterium]|jgi:Mg-chelatase subunit ChlD|nr:VWA domain-containing protein [Tepidisphaeraceae bacterium]